MWLTPEARGRWPTAGSSSGTRTYVDRVPVAPGQRRHGSDNKVESERAEFALDLARRGTRVAVVSSGDPGVFAMASAVLEVGVRGAEYKDMPGTRAARDDRRAARPLPRSGRRSATTTRRSRCRTGSSRGRSSRSGLPPPPRADLVLAICTTRRSRSRTWQVATARDLLLELALAGHAGGRRPRRRRPEEQVRVVALAELDPEAVDMRTLLLVGSSQTQAVTRADGSEVVWTPRRYPGRGAIPAEHRGVIPAETDALPPAETATLSRLRR